MDFYFEYLFQVSPLFQKLEGDLIEALRRKFSGQQVFDAYYDYRMIITFSGKSCGITGLFFS